MRTLEAHVERVHTRVPLFPPNVMVVSSLHCKDLSWAKDGRPVHLHPWVRLLASSMLNAGRSVGIRGTSEDLEGLPHLELADALPRDWRLRISKHVGCAWREIFIFCGNQCWQSKRQRALINSLQMLGFSQSRTCTVSNNQRRKRKRKQPVNCACY